MRQLLVKTKHPIEPLGLMYISAVAKQRGHEVRLAWADETLEGAVEEFEPDVIGYQVLTGSQQDFLALNEDLRGHHNFVSVFGGPHPTFFPEIINEPGVDVICRGEGENANADMLDALAVGGDISEIPNLWVKINGQVIKNGLRPLIQLEDLPSPDRDLLPSEMREGPISHHIAGRGCPFQCGYCFNEKFAELYKGLGSRVRMRNPSSVVSEIEAVVSKDPVRCVYFQDDTFTLSVNWLEQFAEEYAEKVDLPYHCHVRPNTIDPRRADYLAESGCRSVHIAAEAANNRLRNKILRRGMSKGQIVDACDMLRERGIKVMLQNIIGLPTGSLEADMETLELNRMCKPAYAWVSIFQPYPGTTLGEWCKAEGHFTGDFNDLGDNFFDESPLNFSSQYKNQVANLQKLFAVFVENPLHYSRREMLKMINAPRTPETVRKYSEIYHDFRDKADEMLYGFKL